MNFYGYKSIGIIQNPGTDRRIKCASTGQAATLITMPALPVRGDRLFADVNHLEGGSSRSTQDETSLAARSLSMVKLQTASAKHGNAHFYRLRNKIFDYQEDQLETFRNCGFVGIQNLSEQHYLNAPRPKPPNTYAAITANDNVSQNSVPSSAYIENGSF